MPSTIETLALEDITTRHAIDTKWFLPFTIHRLLPHSKNNSVVLHLTILDTLSPPATSHKLQMTWKPESAKLMIPPVQEHILTEWAACGVACAVIPLYTGLEILHVAQVGDRFDYWVGNEKREYGLEVSGTMRTDVEQRHRMKVKQLMQSPHHISGYVSVSGFRSMQSILSFHARPQVKTDE